MPRSILIRRVVLVPQVDTAVLQLKVLLVRVGMRSVLRRVALPSASQEVKLREGAGGLINPTRTVAFIAALVAACSVLD